MSDGAGAITEPARMRGPRPISPAQEKEFARGLSPAVAWPTLALALILPPSTIGLALLGLYDVVPAWACTLPLGLMAYAHYTLVHEAIHGNIVARPKSLAWINTLIGWIGAFGLGAGWHVLQRTHLLHHSHTNTEKDPDIYVKGSFGRLTLTWLRGTLTGLVPIAAARFVFRSGYARLRGVFTERELWLSSIYPAVTLVLLAIAIPTGHVLDWLLLWFIPRRIAGFLLMVFFQWLPHFPFDRTDRYGNTRISLWPGGDVLLLQQNLHLMHHLWPSVPFYNYRALFTRLKPVLMSEGSRIEGLVPKG